MDPTFGGSQPEASIGANRHRGSWGLALHDNSCALQRERLAWFLYVSVVTQAVTFMTRNDRLEKLLPADWFQDMNMDFCWFLVFFLLVSGFLHLHQDDPQKGTVTNLDACDGFLVSEVDSSPED